MASDKATKKTGWPIADRAKDMEMATKMDEKVISQFSKIPGRKPKG